MTWFEVYEEAARRKQERLAGRPVEPFEQAEMAAVRDYYDTHSVADEIESAVWVEDWAPTPTMDRSVHMRPAETQHSRFDPRGAYREVADRVDTAVARSVGWLLSRSGFGGPMG